VAETAYFAARGYRDLTYAVGIAPEKVPRFAGIAREHAATITLLIDDAALVPIVARVAAKHGVTFPVLVEVDTGGGRGGVDPAGAELLDVARAIEASGSLRLAGVLTHAGQSYHACGADELRQVAEEERAGAVLAAERLRATGLPCETVSVGSTPTATLARHLEGVTEMRPGVYMFGDLQQVSLGVCTEADLALSVLATVIGHNRRSGRILIDAGALALSKDLGASAYREGVGYGSIRSLRDADAPTSGLFVAEAHQEHGLVASAYGALPWEALPVGSKVRVLPNHACLTAAPFDQYHVDAGNGTIAATWEKGTGW
jgi:D-serine deaminase-like pyridoxal phosphate-dependent protein